MSGIPHFNFPEFYRVANILRSAGHDIVSPAELDDAEDKGAAMASSTGDPSTAKRTWGEFLSRDVRIIADQVQGIVFMDGWERSRGANLEAFVGLLQGDEFLFFKFERDSSLRVMSRQEVALNIINHRLLPAEYQI